MTARPSVVPGQVGSKLRVIQGRRARRPELAPWMVFSLVVVVALIGLAVARTTLDRGAFELAELDARIAKAELRNQELLLEVARLESPARIGPLAEQMGLVYPETAQPLLVENVADPQRTTDPRWADLRNFAVSEAKP